MKQNTDYLKIQIQDNMLIMEWVGHVDSIDYRHAHQVFLNTASETKNTAWLLDYKKSGDVTYQDSEWTIQEWLPQAAEAAQHVEKISVVVPGNIFNKIPLRIVTSKIAAERPQIIVAFFNDSEEAKAWLLESSERSAAAVSSVAAAGE